MARASKLSPHLAGRIRERLSSLGISEREASRRAGFGVGYVGDLLSGRSKAPEANRLIALAKTLECDLDYLLGMQDSPRRYAETRSFAPPDLQAQVVQRLINLYAAPSLEDAIWVRIVEEPIDKMPVLPPLTHVHGAYALAIPGRQMEPRYYIGEIIYLHPSLAARPGDFVLAKRKDGRSTIARLAEITDVEVILTYLNYPHDERVPKAEIEYVHRIVGSAG